MSEIPPIEEFRNVLNDIMSILQDKDYGKSIHKDFYDDIFALYWVFYDDELQRLYNYYVYNFISIQQSLGKIGHEHKKLIEQSEESIEEELDTKILGPTTTFPQEIEKLKPIKHKTK